MHARGWQWSTGQAQARTGWTHCRYNRVEGVAAYGRAAQRCRRTIGSSGGSGCATVWHRCSATQARDHSVQVASGLPVAVRVTGLASRRWWRDGSVRGYDLLESPCGNRARGLAAAVVAITLHRRRDVGEFWAWRVLLSCLSSAWAPRTGLWRGEESVVCAG